MKKLSVLLLTIIACCMLWACGKTATFNESEEETTTHKKNKTEYSTTAEDVTESFERQTAIVIIRQELHSITFPVIQRIMRENLYILQERLSSLWKEMMRIRSALPLTETTIR